MTEPSATLRVNGAPVPLGEIPSDERLLDTLRWRLGLKGTKEGCRTGDCGACTVLVDGHARLGCLALTRELDGAAVTTIEAVGRFRTGATVQAAFAEEGGLQCGYCTPGFVMAVTALLDEPGAGARSVPLERLGGNLCRCTGYASIVRAVERARGRLP